MGLYCIVILRFLKRFYLYFTFTYERIVLSIYIFYFYLYSNIYIVVFYGSNYKVYLLFLDQIKISNIQKTCISN